MRSRVLQPIVNRPSSSSEGGAKAGLKSSRISLPPLPKLGLGPSAPTGRSTTPLGVPTLRIPLDDEEAVSENDEEEDRHLLAILQKLKEAKSTVDASKQKKRTREIVEESYTNYVKETKTMIAKHNKKWDTKHTQLQQRANKLKGSFRDLLQDLESDQAATQEMAQTLNEKTEKLTKQIEHLEQSSRDDQREADTAVSENLQVMREEIQNYLVEVRNAFLETHRKAAKDDKLSKLIKTFLATF